MGWQIQAKANFGVFAKEFVNIFGLKQFAKRIVRPIILDRKAVG
jgi:hypothetical protein